MTKASRSAGSGAGPRPRGRQKKHADSYVQDERHSRRVRGEDPPESADNNTPNNLRSHNRSPDRQRQRNSVSSPSPEADQNTEQKSKPAKGKRKLVSRKSSSTSSDRDDQYDSDSDGDVQEAVRRSLDSAVGMTRLRLQMFKHVKELHWPSSGKDTISDRLNIFLGQYEKRVTRLGGTPKDMLDLIGECLKGPASSWYTSLTLDPLSAPILLDWERFKAAMIRRFQPPRPYSVVLRDLQTCTKKSGESYAAHLERFLQIVSDASALGPSVFSLQQQVNMYLDTLPFSISEAIETRYRVELDLIHGVGDPTRIGRLGVPTLGEICNWAQSLETEELVKAQRRKRSAASSTNSSTSPSSSSSSEASDSHPWYKGRNYIPNFSSKKQRLNKDAGTSTPMYATPSTSAPEHARPLGPQDSTAPQGSCWSCGKPGHVARYCPDKKKKSG